MMKHRTTEVALYVAILDDIFKLRFFPTIRAKKEILLNGDSCMGLYTCSDDGKHFKHKISFSRKEVVTSANLFATLAHEYVHAYQNEKGGKLGHMKDRTFKTWYNYFLTNYVVNLVTDN